MKTTNERIEEISKMISVRDRQVIKLMLEALVLQAQIEQLHEGIK